MANWSDSNPYPGSNYSTEVLQALIERDKDAASLFQNDPTNPFSGMIRYNRSSNKFQEYNGSAWVDKSLSVAGGGTGATNAADARTNLGIGTMGLQNASAVAITGGSIAGLTTLGVSGAVTFAGGLTAGSGAVAIINAAGKIPALTATYLASLSAAALTSLPVNQFGASIIPAANLGSGTPSASVFLRGDGQWISVPSGVPSGIIAMADTSCPAGWTRVAAWDGKFIRAGSTYGATGGADTHQHTIDSVGDHYHAAGSHTHSATIPVRSTGGDSPNHTHATGVAYRYDVAIGGGTTVVNSVNVNTTGVSATHYHSVPSQGITTGGGSGNTGNSGGHTHTEQAASSLPSYMTVVFCKKD